MAKGFVTTSLTLPARDALRHMTALVSGQLGVPVSASDAIRIADLVITGQQDSVRSAAVSLGIVPGEDTQQ